MSSSLGRPRGRALATGLALAAALVGASPAHAARHFFSDRGVRPLARGGAFVAGADDLGAIYYNPAGIVEAGTQVFFDASWLHFTSSYTRQARITPSDPNTGQPGKSSFVRTFDKVEGSTPVLPIPTLAGSFAITRDLVVAVGMYAPYGVLASYPEKLPGGSPAPQRYSLITLEGSALAVTGAWLGYRPIPELQIGAGPTLLTGTFQSSVYFGACPTDRLVCAPEDPSFDAKGRLTVGTIVAPSATLGVIATPLPVVRIGASFQLPYSVDAPAKFQTRLPSAALFDKASIEGDDARVRFKLPWIARLGVEARPLPTTRIELAFVYEKWSMHDRIDVAPDNVVLKNVALFPPEYRVGGLSIDRQFQDAWSVRLGGEHTLGVGSYKVDLRAGAAYEKSAVPREYLSVLTVDMDKFLLGVGGGLHVGQNWRFDGTLAVLFPSSVDVSPDEARLTKVNPVRATPPPTGDVAINGGHYEASALVLGLGLRYLFDPPPAVVPQPDAHELTAPDEPAPGEKKKPPPTDEEG
jgi:long-chain fatty acid transport protein